jgi:hypothetical protein
MLFVIHDAFLNIYEWATFPDAQDRPNGVLDTHHYEGILSDSGTKSSVWKHF